MEENELKPCPFCGKNAIYIGVCVTMKATFMVIWDASTNKTRGAGFLMTCIMKDGANVSFARMETIKAWVAHCLTRQRMLSKHGTNEFIKVKLYPQNICNIVTNLYVFIYFCCVI